MGEKKEEKRKTDQPKVRTTQTAREYYSGLHAQGMHWEESEAWFLGFLLKLGATVYEQEMLPIEHGKKKSNSVTEPAAQVAGE